MGTDSPGSVHLYHSILCSHIMSSVRTTDRAVRVEGLQGESESVLVLQRGKPSYPWAGQILGGSEFVVNLQERNTPYLCVCQTSIAAGTLHSLIIRVSALFAGLVEVQCVAF